MEYSPSVRGMDSATKIRVSGIDFYYGTTKTLHNLNVQIRARFVAGLIGPSGCGKSTFLRALNRMNDFIPGALLQGKIELDGADIYSSDIDVIELRRRVGMIFQKSNPFPLSIYDNVAYGPRVNRISRRREELDDIVEKTLRSAALWDEVKDRLGHSANSLS